MQVLPYVLNFVLALLHKCLQGIGCDKEKFDSSLVEAILDPFLSSTNTESVLLAKMSLASLHTQITLEDVDMKVLQNMIRSKDTAADALNFVESVVNSDICIATMRTNEGLELMSTVMEWCEGNESQQERAAVLIELLLSN